MTTPASAVLLMADTSSYVERIILQTHLAALREFTERKLTSCRGVVLGVILQPLGKMFRRHLFLKPAALAALYGLMLLALMIGSPLRTIGDGGEYLVYGLGMSHGDAPPLTPERIKQVRTEIRPFDPDRAVWVMEEAGTYGPDGRLDFVHFWLYPALAAPLIGVTRAVNADPRLAFVAINVVLLVTAFFVLYDRLGFGPAVLLLAGPIVWWVDKVHPEVFTVSLMAIALTTWRDRPGIALPCAGLVAAQVAPFTVFVPILTVAILVDRPQLLRRRSFYVALITALILVSLAPLYYLTRFGRLTLFGDVAQVRWPPASDLGVSLFDLNIGLIPNWPLLAIACLISITTVIVTNPRRLLRPEIVGTILGALVLAVAFAHIGNFMHGATPGIMRYAVWMSALSVPLLALGKHRRTTPLIACIAVLSAATSIYYYRPVLEESTHRPTAVALWVWRHFPAFSHPRPDVFAQSLNHRSATVPIATERCDKVLLIGRGDAQGMWPRPCPPAPVPAECRTPGVLCYANRSAREYRFREVRGPIDWLKYDPDTVWPRPAEANLHGLMSRVDWFSMEALPRTARSVIHATRDVYIESLFASRNNALVVLSEPKPGARIELRVSQTTGVLLMDGSTGRMLAVGSDVAAESGVRVLSVPSEYRLLLLATFPQ